LKDKEGHTAVDFGYKRVSSGEAEEAATTGGNEGQKVKVEL
jgi:hypothetical protein